MPRVFDYTHPQIAIPMRYVNSVSKTKPTTNGSWIDYGSTTSTELKSYFCPTDNTNGQVLFGNSQYTDIISCEPHAYNVGNYYNFPAASASTPEPATSSICPKGWSLPENNNNTSYNNLLASYLDKNAPAKTNNDSALLNLPLSFIRVGYYSRLNYYNEREQTGHYRMTSNSLYVMNTTPSFVGNQNSFHGYSVRCVVR